MGDMVDADFVSVPLGDPAFFEAVIDDQVFTAKVNSGLDDKTAEHHQGEPRTRHGSIQWAHLADWPDFGVCIDSDTSFSPTSNSKRSRPWSRRCPEPRAVIKFHYKSCMSPDSSGDAPADLGRYIPLGTTSKRMNITRDIWTKVSSQFELHESTVEAFLDNNGAFGFYPYRATTSPRTLKRISNVSRNATLAVCELQADNILEIVLKVANKLTIGYEALSMVFDLSTLSIKALIHGFIPAQWDSFTSLLSGHLHLCRHPLLLPTMIFRTHRRDIERYRSHIDSSIMRLEIETGFGMAGSLVATRNQAPAQRDFDLESALVQLQSQHTELATVAAVSRFSDKFADFLLESISRLDGALDASNHDSILDLGDEILHLLELPRNQAKTALSQIQSLKERVQSQSSLIFNLISSEENRISRFVAEESAKVAIASKRDSMAMKTVAVLTMIFLPGTFVAAFLSMPLFEWNIDTGGYPSSTPFQWIYWVITLPLTITMMIGWRVWWKLEEKSWNLELEQAKQQNRVRLSSRAHGGHGTTRLNSYQ